MPLLHSSTMTCNAARVAQRLVRRRCSELAAATRQLASPVNDLAPRALELV